MSENEKAAATVIAVVLALAYVVGGVILSGYVLSILWGWFFVPLGAPVLGVAQAIGVALTVRVITNQEQDKSDKEKSAGEKVWSMAKAFIKPLVALGMGWLIVQWV